MAELKACPFEIQQGDCLELLKNIPDNSVDLIIADPPYGINFTKGYKSGNKKLVYGDDGFSVMVFMDDILKEYKRILKPDSAIYIFTRFDVLPYWWLKIKRYFIVKNHLVWDKSTIGMGDLYGNYGNSYESIVFATNGNHKLNGKRDGSILKFKRCKQEYHETQKPVDLLEYLILKSTNKNAVVLDPFMGSGTTGIACINTDRKFIGFELDESYYEIAKKRIEEAWNRRADKA